VAKALHKLSARAIEGSVAKRRLGDGDGLWLNNTASGSKSWIFRWTPRGGKPREIGMGSYPALSLANARQLATEYRAIVAQGKDPKIIRDMKRVVPHTFGVFPVSAHGIK